MFGQRSTFLWGPILANYPILWELEIFVLVLRSLGWSLSILLLHFRWLENGYDVEIKVEVLVLVLVLMLVLMLVLGIYACTLGNRCGIVGNSARYGSFSF